ncbi:MAG TPA: PQQ-binding-like beta-propeller repeat protein [Trebonia sp.]|nr:PQQ-binding-like beta-propeller repeat protein [Trebonia sp.]
MRPGRGPGARRGRWPLLTGLDASTGQARWTQSIVGGVVGPYPTADGGLALLRADDTLEVVNLSSGRVRWTRLAGYPPGSNQVYPPPLTVAAGAVVLAADGTLTSYDDRTGRTRWADALPGSALAAGVGDLNLLAAAGLVSLTGALPGAGDDDGHPVQALFGISAADGRVRWKLAASPAEALWAYAPGLMSVGSGAGGATWQDDLDPATGRIRWRAASAYHALATPGGTVTGPGPDGAGQISLRDPLTGQIRWTAALAGLDAGWQQTSPDLPVFSAGPVLIVAAARLAGPGPLTAVRRVDGQRAWQVTIPEPVAAPPTAVAGGTLVYAADLRLPP